MTRITFLTAAGPGIGSGHAARTAIVAAAAARLELEVRIVADDAGYFDRTPIVAVPDVASAPWTAPSLRSRLEPLGADDLVWIDVPDDLISELAWLPDAPRVVAFRMLERSDGAVVEHVRLHPRFAPPTTERCAARRPFLARTGRDLILVRPNLFRAGAARPPAPPSVLLTMGGADPHDLTWVAALELESIAGQVAVHAVLGDHYARRSEFAERFGGRMHVHHQGAVDFDALLGAATVAVINGGLTRYECIAAETPFVAMSFHEAQRRITEEVTREGFGVDLGVHPAIPTGALVAAVADLLDTPAKRDAMVRSVAGTLLPDAAERLIADVLAERHGRRP